MTFSACFSLPSLTIGQHFSASVFSSLCWLGISLLPRILGWYGLGGGFFSRVRGLSERKDNSKTDIHMNGFQIYSMELCHCNNSSSSERTWGAREEGGVLKYTIVIR